MISSRASCMSECCARVASIASAASQISEQHSSRAQRRVSKKILRAQRPVRRNAPIAEMRSGGDGSGVQSCRLLDTSSTTVVGSKPRKPSTPAMLSGVRWFEFGLVGWRGPSRLVTWSRGRACLCCAADREHSACWSRRATCGRLSLAIMDGPWIDRSRFLDRETLDPHHVMETSSSSQGMVGAHTEGNMDFLKPGEVDLGVRRLGARPCPRPKRGPPRPRPLSTSR